jgi:hypothetical protein
VKRNPKKLLKKNKRVPKKGKRKLGIYGGKIIIPDDFDAPLPDEILDLFEAPIDLGNGSPKRKKSSRASD